MGVLAPAALAFALSGCAPRPRMCTITSECSSKSACVAGRCQLDVPSVKPAVDSARRVVVRPVDVACVNRGERSSGGVLPTVFAIGKDGGKLFLRFAVALPPAASVVEAYVVLRRSLLVDDDPAALSLHAARIIEPWEGGSVSWVRQPRVAEGRTPSTTVDPTGAPLVRVDVRDLVIQWRRRDPIDQGVAIVAEGDTATGTTFALVGGGGAGSPSSSDATREESLPAEAAAGLEPYLELYLR